MNITESNGRPKGCFFDVYGADEEMLRTLTCENCPLPAMVCDFRGYAVIDQIAAGLRSANIVSDK